MPSITDRVLGVVAGAARRVEQIARAARGPEETTVVQIPGARAAGPGPTAHHGGRAEAALRSWDAYSGRVSPSAGPTQTRYALWPGDNLTPEIVISAQRDAITSGYPLRWVELLDQVYSRDGHYAGVTDQRVVDVVKGTWRLTRAAGDVAGTATRNFAETVFRSCSRWTDGLEWLLYSNLYSYNAVEVVWGEQRIAFEGPKGETIAVNVAVPVRLYATHPKHVRFDLITDDPLLWLGSEGVALPYGKFVFLDGDGAHPIKVRHGHGWQCIWYSMFRSIGWAGWAMFVERFGMPMPLIKYDGEIAQYAEMQAAYQDMLNSLGTGKGGTMPKDGAEIEFIEPPRGGTASDPHAALADACDAGQSIRVLGATLTAKIGNVGSFAASTTHAEVKYAKEERDARRLWERIDEQLTRPLIEFNALALADALKAHGYNVTPELLCRRIPRGKHTVPRATDPETEVRIAGALVNELGMPLSMEGLFDRIDFARARNDDDRVPGKAETVGKGAALIPAAEAAQPGGAKNPDEAAEATAQAKVAETNAAIDNPALDAEPAPQESTTPPGAADTKD